MGSRQVLFNQLLERPFAVLQGLRNICVNITGAVSCVEFSDMLQKLRGLRNSGVEFVHGSSLQSLAIAVKKSQGDYQAQTTSADGNRYSGNSTKRLRGRGGVWTGVYGSAH